MTVERRLLRRDCRRKVEHPWTLRRKWGQGPLSEPLLSSLRSAPVFCSRENSWDVAAITQIMPTPDAINKFKKATAWKSCRIRLGKPHCHGQEHLKGWWVCHLCRIVTLRSTLGALERLMEKKWESGRLCVSAFSSYLWDCSIISNMSSSPVSFNIGLPMGNEWFTSLSIWRRTRFLCGLLSQEACNNLFARSSSLNVGKSAWKGPSDQVFKNWVNEQVYPSIMKWMKRLYFLRSLYSMVTTGKRIDPKQLQEKLAISPLISREPYTFQQLGM